MSRQAMANNIRTSWRLEPFLSYGDDPAGPVQEQLHIIEQSEQPSLEQTAGIAPQHSSSNQQRCAVQRAKCLPIFLEYIGSHYRRTIPSG